MSSFIANTISFSHDFSTFKMKGGDSNVYPRPNYWSKDIPIGELLRELDGRTTQLNRNKYSGIHKKLNQVQKEFENLFW